MFNTEKSVSSFCQERKGTALPSSISEMIKEQIKRPESSVQPSFICVLYNNAAMLPSCLASDG